MPPMDKSKEKTALDAITLAFAIELAPDGIKVNAVAQASPRRTSTAMRVRRHP